jgi:formiminotetrahydrofolate cyclodeaminase
MPWLGSRQVGDALEAFASPAQPAAAGAASAFACAAAAALVELTAGLAADRVAGQGGAASAQAAVGLRGLAVSARELRGRLLAAADEDARAYSEVTAAPDGPARAQALARASEPPLEIAECAAAIAEAAAEITRAGAWGFTADAIVAGELATAAARSGAELVMANLAGDAHDPRTDRARAATDRAERASRAATNGSGG